MNFMRRQSYEERREQKRLERLNDLYDLCTGARPATPPSLEAIQGWLEQHRDLQHTNARYEMADAAVENVSELRRAK